jgi:uncharacterized protein (TIGR03437 family)
VEISAHSACDLREARPSSDQSCITPIEILLISNYRECPSTGSARARDANHREARQGCSGVQKRNPLMIMTRITTQRRIALALVFLLNLTSMPASGWPVPASLHTVPASAPASLTESEKVAAKRKFSEETFGRLPLQFESNQGQVAEPVKFLARGPGYNLFLTDSEAILALRGSQQQTTEYLRLKLIGARQAPAIGGLDQLPGRNSYFIGQNPAQWRTDIATYGKVEYRDVYPGVSLVYYGRQRELEYDFIVAPGADPRAIRMNFAGARSIRLDHAGDLVLRLRSGAVRQHKPVVYQEINGQRQIIPARYVISRRHGKPEISFALGEYDRTRALVIDPVLAYATFLGGSGIDIARGIAVDGTGNVYVAGFTQSVNFPSAVRVPSGNPDTNGEAFITKLNSSGTILYSVYIGGGSADAANDLAIDAGGAAYITGQTQSSNFPTVSAAQGTFGGGTCNPGSAVCFDGFVAKLNPAGNQLAWSTYLGGNGDDLGFGIATGSDNSVVVTGQAAANFPLRNAVRNTFGGGAIDGFVAKYDSAGAQIYSTYLGGQNDDLGRSVAVDATLNAYITGFTRSTNFPTAAPVQANLGGGNDAFVTKLNASGSQILYSTYLGGSFDDEAYGIAADATGIYVSGVTGSSGTGSSTRFPLQNPVQANYGGGGRDAFITKLNAAGSAFIFSTWYGGSDDDYGSRVAVDSGGNVYVTGNTFSTNFPLENIVPAAAGSGSDAFIVKLNPAGTTRLFSTYAGGNGNDFGNAIAVDGAGNAYIAGDTTSTSFPVFSAIQANPGGVVDGFVIKLDTTRNVSNFVTVSAASYRGDQMAPDSIVAGFAPGLASGLATASTTPLPTALGGVSVRIRDTNGVEQLAPLFFVSPNQINYLLPANVAAGRASATVINSATSAIISAGVISVAAIGPGLFTADSTGSGAPAAFAIRVTASGQQIFEPVSNGATPLPIDLGPQGELVFLVLYGTGIRGRTAQNQVTVNFLSGSTIVSATGVEYASVAPGFIGLDQVNLILPRTLAGRGLLDLTLTANGVTSNAVKINIR